jgi:hypothetical protein
MVVGKPPWVLLMWLSSEVNFWVLWNRNLYSNKIHGAEVDCRSVGAMVHHRVRHQTLSSARWIQYTPLQTTINFNIFPSTPGSPTWSLLRFPNQNFVSTYFLHAPKSPSLISSPCSSLGAGNQVSYPYKATGETVVSCYRACHSTATALAAGRAYAESACPRYWHRAHTPLLHHSPATRATASINRSRTWQIIETTATWHPAVISTTSEKQRISRTAYVQDLGDKDIMIILKYVMKPRKSTPGTHLTGSWVGPKWQEKILENHQLEDWKALLSVRHRERCGKFCYLRTTQLMFTRFTRRQQTDAKRKRNASFKCDPKGVFVCACCCKVRGNNKSCWNWSWPILRWHHEDTMAMKCHATHRCLCSGCVWASFNEVYISAAQTHSINHWYVRFHGDSFSILHTSVVNLAAGSGVAQSV